MDPSVSSPNFVLRAYRGPEDHPAMNDVANAVRARKRVAFDGDAIAGQILNFMDEPGADGTRLGMTEAISVQPEYRRRGLARALLAKSLRAVQGAGATSAGLGVDTQNPNEALTLYESLGFRITGETFEYELRTLPPTMAPDADPRAMQ